MEGELAGFTSLLDIRARERDDRRITPSSLAGATRSTEVLWLSQGGERVEGEQVRVLATSMSILRCLIRYTCGSILEAIG